jgi:hypothetical protein
MTGTGDLLKINPRETHKGRRATAANDWLEQLPEVIIGIGKEAARTLRRMGIRTVADLISRDLEFLAARLPRRWAQDLRRWVACASLLRVRDMSPRLAAVLVAAGVDSLGKLKGADLLELRAGIRKASRQLKAPSIPTTYQLAALQQSAARLDGTTLFSGQVLDAKTGKPINDAVVHVGGESPAVNSGGLFRVNLSSGRHLLRVEVRGRRSVRTWVSISSTGVSGRVSFRLGERKIPKREQEIREADGRPVWLWPGMRTRLVERTIAEIPQGVYLLVSDVGRTAKTRRLVNLYRVRAGEEVLTEVVNVPLTMLPEDAASGRVLQYQGGHLTTTTLTLRDVALKKFEALVGPRRLTPLRRIVRLKA